MSDIAIRVEGLSKSYLVGHNATQRDRYTALRDVVARNIRDLARKTRDMARGRPIVQGDEVEEFWALRDISFEVKRGETLGIIGRNGAGKSTLLKILSRITEPTKGRIELHGRVASLLEVGTGFHPELTGRENIFLNGAILGMSRTEIQRKFDEIVAFAEVERFLDTPVKRYSSGMYVRLAFAVAAHLEPEILVVDEVLAVGDASFQKKCLGKIGEVTKGGRTVLFVSHNMAAVEQLCSSGLLLVGGRIAQAGEIGDAIAKYLLSHESAESRDLSLARRNNIYPRQYSHIVSCEILNEHLRPCSEFWMGQDILFRIRIEITVGTKQVELGIGIRSASNVAIHYLHSSWAGGVYDLGPGLHSFLIRLPSVKLFPHRYIINCYVTRNSKMTHSDDCVFNVGSFHIMERDITGMFEKLSLSNTFAHYASSGSEVYTESEWTHEVRG